MPSNTAPSMPIGLSLGLQQVVGGGADEAGLGDVAPAVAREIAHHLAAAHRIADERRVAHAGLLDDGGKIVGEGIEVVAGGGLRRAAEAAAIVGDDPVAGLRQRRGLIVPDVGIQRPGVGQHHGAAGAAGVLDEDFDAILGLDLRGAGRLWPKAMRGSVAADAATSALPRKTRRVVMIGSSVSRSALWPFDATSKSSGLGPERSSRVLEAKTRRGPHRGDDAARGDLADRRGLAYRIATGLIMLCTAPLKRGWPSTNMNS